MDKQTFAQLYTLKQMQLDARYMQTYRPSWNFFRSKQCRIIREVKFWSCWLRYHRWLKTNNSVAYYFRIMHCVEKECKAFRYIDSKKQI